MSFRYYNFIGTPGRVFFEEDIPDFCETYDLSRNEMVLDNENLLDMLEHPQSIEMSRSQFELMIHRLQNPACIISQI